MGEEVTEERGLWLVAIYTELVLAAVQGRWRIAVWLLHDTAGRTQVCESQLAGRGPILRGGAEKATDRRGHSATSRGAGGESETSESCWLNGEARAK